MKALHLAGIKIEHQNQIEKDDTDRLVDSVSQIELDDEKYTFMEIKINNERYLCIQVAEDTLIPL